jgi:phospholipid/cholesterol/gamma-HCH transport system permease protein
VSWRRLPPLFELAGSAADSGTVAVGALPRATGRGLRAVLGFVVLSFALAAAVLREAARPRTWRRPVRRELIDFLDRTAIGTMPAVAVAALLAGVSIIAQALYWTERLGEVSEIRTIVVWLTVREVGPLIVALLMIGRGGLVLTLDLALLRRDRIWRALDAQGVDPFLLLVLPRVLAIAIGCFSLTILFVVVAFVAGFATARASGAAAALGVLDVVPLLLQAIGENGAIFLLLKTSAMGLAIGVVASLAAMEPDALAARGGGPVPSAFVRAVLAILLISGLFSMAGR